MKFKRIFFFFSNGDFEVAERDDPNDKRFRSDGLPSLTQITKDFPDVRIEGRAEDGAPYIIKYAGSGILKSPRVISWDDVPWTAFIGASVAHYPEPARPHQSWMNSIYQVSVWYHRAHAIFGDFAHLSFKTHDRAPRHDWREMQRIKNEIAGPDRWAVEMFPPESKVVDTSNQYHLYAFATFQFQEIGFRERLVSEGDYDGAVQRPFRPEFRPPDLKSKEEMQKDTRDFLAGTYKKP